MSSSNEPPVSSSDATADEIFICTANWAAILIRNQQRADKRSAGEVDVLDDEVLSNDDLKSNINKGEEFSVEEDFSKLQNLSPEDFKTALNFSINCAAKAE